MLLTIQQRFVLELLRKIGCLRRDQIRLLLQKKFVAPDCDYQISLDRADQTMRHLRHCIPEIRMEDDLLRLVAVAPDRLYLEAVDVMLELSDGRPQMILTNQPPPVLLRFSLEDEKLRLFAIAHFSEKVAILPGDIVRHQTERVIWISEGGRAPGQLALPPKHFFAVRQENGSHRFYGGDGS